MSSIQFINVQYVISHFILHNFSSLDHETTVLNPKNILIVPDKNNPPLKMYVASVVERD